MVSKIGKWFPYWVIERFFIKKVNPWSRMYLTTTAAEPDEHFINEVHLEEQTEVNVWRVDENTWICKTTKSVIQKKIDEHERKINELKAEL